MFLKIFLQIRLMSIISSIRQILQSQSFTYIQRLVRYCPAWVLKCRIGAQTVCQSERVLRVNLILQGIIALKFLPMCIILALTRWLKKLDLGPTCQTKRDILSSASTQFLIPGGGGGFSRPCY